MMNKVDKIPQVIASNERGSSLIGVAVLTLALGFLVTGGIFLMQNYAVIKADQTSVEHFKAVQAGIKDFIAREKRFPCPAALNLAPDQSAGGVEFGKEISTNCATAPNTPGTFVALGRDGERVRIGAVPIRSLNMPDRKMMDGYGKRFFYAITESLASPGTDVKNDLGAITITNEQGHSLSDAAGHVVYALISPGTDDRGAYNENGALMRPCEAGTNAGNNCDFIAAAAGTADATFISSTVKSFGVGSTSFTHNFAFHSNAIPYKWNTDAWEECGDRFKTDLTIEVCFSGTQYRDIRCEDHKGNVVPPGTNVGQEEHIGRCGHTPKPTGSRVCSLPPCYWNANSWAVCTAGTGINPPPVPGDGNLQTTPINLNQFLNQR